MGRSLQMPTAPVRNLSFVVGVDKGGTGANNPIDAATNLGLVTTALLGAVGGAVKVESGGKIATDKLPTSVVNGPTLNGPSDVYAGQTCVYTITNYDSSLNYAVSASAGTISRTGDTITWVAPSLVQTATLTIAGRTVTVNVKAIAPVQPSITAPVANASNIGTAYDFVASAFQLSSGVGSHQFSDWQIASDPAFTNIVASTTGDTVNKTTWSSAGFAPGSTYYVRVRYKDLTKGYSPWSNSVKFSTRTSFSPTNEEASFTFEASYADPPQCIAVSNDGLRVATAYYYFSGAMRVVVCSKASGSWVVEQVIATLGTNTMSGPPLEPPNLLDISGAGDRLVFGEWNTNSGAGANSGAIQIWSRSGTTWTLEQRIIGVTGVSVNSASFGGSVAIDTTGTRVFATAESPQGVVAVFTRSGTVWTLEQSINVGALYSRSFSVDRAGSCFIIALQAGTFAVYERTGTVWASVVTNLLSASSTTVAVISNGGQYIVYATGTTIGVLKRNGNTWPAFNNTVASTLSRVAINADATVIAAFSPRSGSTGIQLLKLSGSTWALDPQFNAVNWNTQSPTDVAIRSDGLQLIEAAQTRFISFI